MKSNIRKLRNERNLSQAELANIIGKTQQTVSHMEKDRDRIPIESLIALADYFGVSTDCVLGIEEEEKTEKEDTVQENSGNSKLIYDLILSLLLCSLEESL